MKRKLTLRLHFRNIQFIISWLWVPCMLFMWYTHTLKTMMCIFLMLSIHEGAHILFARVFQYEISSVIVYPFGVCAHMDHMGYGNIYKELLIIIAGPLTHLCFPFFIYLAMHTQLISDTYGQYLLMINTSIFIFNILPVYPLDGGRVIQSLLHLIFRFKTAQICTLIISLWNLWLLYSYRFLNGVSGTIVLLFLGMQIVTSFYQLSYQQLAFYHYRYHHPASGAIILNDGKDLYRSKTNIMKVKHGWMDEKQWLSFYFQRPLKKRKHSTKIL